MKKCTRCAEVKTEAEFPAKGRRCRKCCSVATQEWYAKKAANEAERVRLQKRRNDWHQNKLRTDPAYRERHLARRRKKHAENYVPGGKDAVRSAARLRTTKGRAMTLLAAARMRDRDCNLEIDDILLVIETGTCPRTGLKFDLEPHPAHHRHPLSPSIDRISRSRGYVRGNVQIVCSWYNIAKNEYTDEQMLAFCRAVVDANQ